MTSRESRFSFPLQYYVARCNEQMGNSPMTMMRTFVKVRLIVIIENTLIFISILVVLSMEDIV